MSKLPEARTKLIIIAKALAITGLHDIANEITDEVIPLLVRKEPFRRARAVRISVTPEMRRNVIDLAGNETLTMEQIADKVGLKSAARVSEILNGQR